MKNFFKKAWLYLNEKKTAIGTIILILAKGMRIFAPDLLPPNQLDFIESIGVGISTGGLGHKAIKAEIPQKGFKKAVKIGKKIVKKRNK